MDSLEQLSLHLSRGQLVLEQDFRGKGLFLTKDCITVGPGISSTLTLVPFGPVSFSLALSSSNLQFFGEAQAAAARIYQIIFAEKFSCLADKVSHAEQKLLHIVYSCALNCDLAH